MPSFLDKFGGDIDKLLAINDICLEVSLGEKKKKETYFEADLVCNTHGSAPVQQRYMYHAFSNKMASISMLFRVYSFKAPSNETFRKLNN